MQCKVGDLESSILVILFTITNLPILGIGWTDVHNCSQVTLCGKAGISFPAKYISYIILLHMLKKIMIFAIQNNKRNRFP
jgi:hypothetical protein